MLKFCALNPEIHVHHVLHHVHTWTPTPAFYCKKDSIKEGYTKVSICTVDIDVLDWQQPNSSTPRSCGLCATHNRAKTLARSWLWVIRSLRKGTHLYCLWQSCCIILSLLGQEDCVGHMDQLWQHNHCFLFLSFHSRCQCHRKLDGASGPICDIVLWPL